MGVGGISIWQLLIILVIVLLLFGTKRLRNLGSDLGNAVKGFRKSMSDESAAESEEQKLGDKSGDKQEKVIEGEATREKDKV